MRGFLILVVLLLVGIVGLGFYRGWFQLSADNTEHKAHTTLTVDQDKIQQDKEKVEEFGAPGEGKSQRSGRAIEMNEMYNESITLIDQPDGASDGVCIPPYTDEAVQREMSQRYCRGASPESLARRYGLDVAGVRQVLAPVRYERIKALPLDPVPNDEFPRATATREKAILGPTPIPAKPPPRVQPPAGLPPYLASLYEVPLLTREQEVHLFRKMNYVKYKASKLIARLDPEHLNNRLLDQIEELYQQSIEVKNQLIRANLRLVVAMTKRYAYNTEPLFELVSDGNISLMRAVEKFDFARGFRFSTYATWAIIKNFTQTIWRDHRDHARFPNAVEEVFQAAPDQRTNQQAEETAQIRRESEVAQLLEQLDDRERQIIRYRYGLDSGREPMTLKEVGSEMGVTKERIRQLANRAIAKLHQAAVEQGIHVPEDLADAPELWSHGKNGDADRPRNHGRASRRQSSDREAACPMFKRLMEWPPPSRSGFPA